MYITSTCKRITCATTNCHAGTKLGEAIWQEYRRYKVKVYYTSEHKLLKGGKKIDFLVVVGLVQSSYI